MKIRVESIIEQALGTLVATIIISSVAVILKYFLNVTNEGYIYLFLAGGLLLFGLIYWRKSRMIFISIAQWIIVNAFILLLIMIVIITSVILYKLSSNNLLLTIISLITNVILLSTIILRNIITIKHTQIIESKPLGECTIINPMEGTEYVKECSPKTIEQWEVLPTGYKPIPLGSDLANADILPNIDFMSSRPLFGKDRIPFHLNIKGRRIYGMEVMYRPSTTQTESKLITPGANKVTIIYLLLSSRNALRIVEQFEFDGKRIGNIFFFTDTYKSFTVNIVLGKNIRDWSYKHPLVVQNINDMQCEQVWHDSRNIATIDMMKIIVPDIGCNIVSSKITTSIDGLPNDYHLQIPSIRLFGITYRTM